MPILFFALIIMVLSGITFFIFSKRVNESEVRVWRSYYTDIAQDAAESIIDAIVNDIKASANKNQDFRKVNWFALFRIPPSDLDMKEVDLEDAIEDDLKIDVSSMIKGLKLEKAVMAFKTFPLKSTGKGRERDQKGFITIRVTCSYRGVKAYAQRQVEFKTIRVKHPILNDYLLIVRDAYAESMNSSPLPMCSKSASIWSSGLNPYGAGMGLVTLNGAVNKFIGKVLLGVPNGRRFIIPLGTGDYDMFDDINNILDAFKSKYGFSYKGLTYITYSQAKRKKIDGTVLPSPKLYAFTSWNYKRLEPWQILFGKILDGVDPKMKMNTGDLRKYFVNQYGIVKCCKKVCKKKHHKKKCKTFNPRQKFIEQTNLKNRFSFRLEGWRLYYDSAFINPEKFDPSLYKYARQGADSSTSTTPDMSYNFEFLVGVDEAYSDKYKKRLWKNFSYLDMDFLKKGQVMTKLNLNGKKIPYTLSGLRLFAIDPSVDSARSPLLIEGNVWARYALLAVNHTKLKVKKGSSFKGLKDVPFPMPFMWYARNDGSGWKIEKQPVKKIYDYAVNKLSVGGSVKGGSIPKQGKNFKIQRDHWWDGNFPAVELQDGCGCGAPLADFKNPPYFAFSSAVVEEPIMAWMKRFGYIDKVKLDYTVKLNRWKEIFPFPFKDQVTNVWTNFNEFLKQRLYRDINGNLIINVNGIHYVKGDIVIDSNMNYEGQGALITTGKIKIQGSIAKLRPDHSILYLCTINNRIYLDGGIGVEAILCAYNKKLSPPTDSSSASVHSYIVGPLESTKPGMVVVNGAVWVDWLNLPTFVPGMNININPTFLPGKYENNSDLFDYVTLIGSTVNVNYSRTN